MDSQGLEREQYDEDGTRDSNYGSARDTWRDDLQSLDGAQNTLLRDGSVARSERQERKHTAGVKTPSASRSDVPETASIFSAA